MKAESEYIKYVRTKRGLITKIYHSQILSSVRKRHKRVDYNRKELIDWCLKQYIFHELFDNWVNSNYEHLLIPSIDRTKNEGGYNFGNIKLMTFGQNKKKGFNDIKSGNLICNQPHKVLIQYDLQGNFIREFISLSEASRELNISKGNLSLNVNGKRKQCGGFNFALKKQL